MNARNFLRLAAIAYRSGKFDEAGVMFAQAADSSDFESLVGDLETDDEELRSMSSDSDAVSKHIRRRGTRVATAISAALEAVSSDDEEVIEDFQDDEPLSDTPDADIPGIPEIIPSFSSGNDEKGFRSVLRVKA